MEINGLKYLKLGFRQFYMYIYIFIIYTVTVASHHQRRDLFRHILDGAYITCITSRKGKRSTLLFYYTLLYSCIAGYKDRCCLTNLTRVQELLYNKRFIGL